MYLSETVFIITQYMYNAVIKRSMVYAGNLSLININFAFNRLIQLFLSDIVPSSLMNFEICNSILRFSIFSQTVQF